MPINRHGAFFRRWYLILFEQWRMEMKTEPQEPINPIDGHCDGLTKREHFAGLAMQGFMQGFIANPDRQVSDQIIANASTRLADALIAALNEK